jgi:hypothetical protein
MSHTLSPITLGNRWRLSTKNTRVIQTAWSFHKSGWRASKNLYPSRSKAPRVINPPSLLGLFQVLKVKGERDLLTNSLQIPLSINARQGFGRE